MAQEKWTEDQLEILTKEERDGLLDDDLVDEGQDEEDAEDAAAAEADAAAAAVIEGTKRDEAAAAAAAAAAALADGVITPPAKVEEEPPARPAPSSPLPKYEAPADGAAQLQTLRDQQDALAQKFDDGELTALEFKAQDRALDDKISDLRDQSLKASMSHDSLLHAWSTDTVPAFLRDHKEYEAGSPLYESLDLQVRKLQAASDSPFDPEILTKAHEIIAAGVRKAFGIPDPAPKPGAKPNADLGKREIPPNLAHVPAADATDLEEGSRWAYLDRLTPSALEAAMAKLSEAERDAYLAQ